jgi:proteic killer suppression protein
MIQSFKCKETQKIFETGFSRRFPVTIIRSAIIKLAMLNNAGKLDDLKVPPSNRLEKLSGDRVGQYSIRINDQYRVCFRWIKNTRHEHSTEGSPLDVEIADYH